MSRLHSHINTAKTIITSYKGETPFSTFLKNFFSKEKKYGSRDRKSISSLCYNYFRTGDLYSGRSFEEKLQLSMFLCTDTPNEYLQESPPAWNENIALPVEEKLAVAGVDAGFIFPFNGELSEQVDVAAFGSSFLVQPDLFARIRPGTQQKVVQKLLVTQVPFKQVNDTCLAFANGTKLEEVFDINREAVIQDMNSQRVGELITATSVHSNANVWDCCAASGGKSIMAIDLLKEINLTVSDVRSSIIHNLKQRFTEAGIRNYHSFVADLTNKSKLKASLGKAEFDLVICDAPCTGSGTWGRTPEQLLYFKQEEVDRYSKLQKTIASNTIPFVKQGGYLLYITCSLFRKENEEVVEHILQQSTLTIVDRQLYKGYHQKADTMFAALFKA